MKRDRGALVLLGCAVGAALVAAYLTLAHYAGAALVCVEGRLIDCAAVTSSSFSLVPGTDIPVALPGLGWALVSGVLAGLALRDDEPGWVAPAHLAWAAAALAVVLYLVYAELVVVHRICEWCTVFHVLVLVSFVAALRRLQAS